jgi:lipid A 3-O-deacylase
MAYTFLTFAQQTDSVPTENYLRFGYENDFFNHTDRYYTQGIQLQLVYSAIRYSPVSKALLRFRSGKNYYGLQLEQDCYTPRDITFPGVYYGERPFSGVFLLSHTLNSLDSRRKQALVTQLNLGAIGPCVLCEQEQKGIHWLTESAQPIGWEYQINNEFLVNYSVCFEKAVLYTRYAELIGLAGARVGNLFTDAQAGLYLRTGFLQPYFNNPGLGQSNSDRRFQCYIEGKVQVRVVGYNQTLQGGFFSTSPYTVPDGDINRALLLTHLGFTVAYRRISVKYSKSFISREFKGGLQHGWGGIEIRVAI